MSSFKPLQEKAEAAAKTTSMQVAKMSMLEIQQLVHELQVHQIELEMQNEELLRAQRDLQEARDHYAHLYDFVPVGFFTLNSEGFILDANLTACQFLEVERKVLLHQKLEDFVNVADQPTLRLHLQKMAQRHLKDVSEVLQLKHNQGHFLVRLQSLKEETSGVPAEPIIRIVLTDLTEQVKAKTLQREQEALLGGVLDTAMDAIVTVDERQRILLFNKGAVKIFRCPSSKVIGKSLDQFIPQRFRKIHRAYLEQFLQSGEVVRSVKSPGSLSALRADGEEFPIEASVSQFVVAGKMRLTVILRDITERRQATRALENSLSKQRSLAQMNEAILNSLLAHIALIDAKGVIVSVNQAWKHFATENMFKGADFGVGDNYITVCEQAHGDCAEEARMVAEGICAVLAGTQKGFEIEYPCHAPNKEERWFRVTITPISEIEYAGAVVMHLNITERRKAEETIRVSHQVFESSPDHISVVGYDYRYRQVNHAYEVAHGLSQKEIVGMHIMTLLGEEVFQKIVKPHFDRALAGEAVSYESWFNLQALGQRFMAVTYAPLRERNNTIESIVVTARDLTDRKLADEALMKSEAQRQLAMGAAKVGTWTWDITTNEMIWSQNVEEIFGLFHGAFAGTYQAYLDLIHPSDQSAVNEAVLKTVNQNAPYDIEHRIIWPDASTHWVSCRGNIIRNQSGKPFWFAGTVVDITERRQAQDALEKEQQFISTILDTAGALVVVLDPEWRIVRFNRACESLTGRTIDEMRGKSFIDLSVASGEDAQEVKNLLLSYKGRQFPKSFESAWIDQSRQLHWIRWSNTVVPDQDGKTENLIATGIDITNRKRAERALSREQKFISAVLDTAGALVVVLDRYGNIVRFNRACEELTGHSFENVQGRPLWDLLLLPEEIPAVKKVFGELREETLSNQFENHWVTKDGQTRQISWSNTILTNDKGAIDYVIGVGIDVTERRKAEREVHRIWRQKELILNSAGEGIYGIDVNGKGTFFNPGAEKLTGWTLQDVQGQVLHPLLHHTKSDGTPYRWEECPVYSTITHGKVHKVDTEVLWRKDGTSFQVEYSSTPILNEDNTIGGAVVTFRDITERKQAEAKIRRLSKVFMDGADPIIIEDLAGKVIDLNDEAVRVYGWSRLELLGKPIKTIVPPERHAQADELLQRCRHQEDVRNVEGLRQTKKGKILPVLLTLSLLTDESGKLIGIATMAKDISDLKQAENKIRESEERFQAFMNHSPAVAFLKNEKGQYVYVNQLWEEKLHLSKTDCLGKTDNQLFPPELSSIFKEHDQEVLKTREVLETEETTLDDEGKVRYWWVMKFPVYSKEGKVLLGGVALDITTRKEMEEALRLREEELQKSHEGLQALGGQLITAQEDERRRISRELHDDMNQRLAVLALNIQSAQKGLGKSTPTHQVLQKLYDGVSALSDDVRRLAYQLHPSILDDLGLEVAIRSFVDDFSKLEGIPVAFVSTDVSFPQSQKIASCLYRVTQECLRNVTKHAKATKVDVKLMGKEDGLILSIKDNGKGFKVGKMRKGKVGLGLVGMEERIRTVQGTFQAKSDLGKGTQITVWVPLGDTNKKGKSEG